MTLKTKIKKNLDPIGYACVFLGVALQVLGAGYALLPLMFAGIVIIGFNGVIKSKKEERENGRDGSRYEALL